MEPSPVWFKRKRYGWGWVPATWQGWLVLGLYLVGVVLIINVASLAPQSGSDVLITIVVPSLLLTALLIFICYKKGEKPRWQWGKETKDS